MECSEPQLYSSSNTTVHYNKSSNGEMSTAKVTIPSASNNIERPATSSKVKLGYVIYSCNYIYIYIYIYMYVCMHICMRVYKIYLFSISASVEIMHHGKKVGKGLLLTAG